MPSVAGRALPFVVAVALVASGLFLEKLGAPGSAAASSGLLSDESGSMGDWLLGVAQPGRWLAFVGVLLGVLAAAREVERGLTGTRRDWTLVGVAAAVLLALAALRGLALEGKRHDIPGVGAVWCLDDDMMITLRYAANLASGHGLVWNEGERVEGITNLLWALLLAPPHWFLGRDVVALAAIALDALLLVAAIVLTARLVRRLGGSGFAATLAAVALATHQGTLHWSAAGSEALLLAVLLLVVANVVAHEAPSSRARAAACVAGGLAWITRPDAAPALVALLALPIARGFGNAAPDAPGTSARAASWKLLALLLAAPLAAVLFRLAYYGSPLPNTYWLKLTGWKERPLAGVEYLLRLLSQHGAHVALAVAALLAANRRGAALVLAALLAHLAYVAWAGGDELPRQRFFVPVAPLLFALSLTGAEQLARRIGGAAGPSIVVRPLALPVALVAIGGLGGGLLPGAPDPGGASRARAEKASVMAGLLIRANTQPDAKVAHFWAGATAYFSQRPGIDLLGKCDPVIAREDAKPGLMRPGHNKHDFERSLGLEPDVVVGGLGGRATKGDKQNWERGPYRAFTDLYDARGFLPLYVGATIDEIGRLDRMPQLVGGKDTQLPAEYADVSRLFHALFVRAGSTRARPPAQWVAPTREELR
jgi:arabinofuranosyltransferase